MEILGYKHVNIIPHIQRYVTTCSDCGAILCFTDKDLKWSEKTLSLDKMIRCPNCCRQITVFKEKQGWFSRKIVLDDRIRAITEDEYAELSHKYDE